MGVIYDIVAHPRFVGGIEDKIGCQLKATLLANLHLFSPKQQRYFQSEAGIYAPFIVPNTSAMSEKVLPTRERSSSPRAAGAGVKAEKGKRKRSTSSNSDSDQRRREQIREKARKKASSHDTRHAIPIGYGAPSIPVDPRLFH